MNTTTTKYATAVKKFAARAEANWKKLNTFAKQLKMNDKQFNQLCKVVEGYGIMNAGIFEYAHKNNLNMYEFAKEVVNATNLQTC